MTSDRVNVIDSRSVDDLTYFLVHRISGWHDKVESFELYNTRPTVDACGNSSVQPLMGLSVDDKDFNNNDKHVAHVYLVPPDRLILEYEQGPIPDTNHNQKLILELRGEE